MIEKLSKEKAGLFERVIKSLNLVLTNSLLYASSHPALNSSVESLKNALDKWFVAEEELGLGISPSNLLLDGSFIKEDNALYRNVAGHLHKKGLIKIVFKNGISVNELLKFFDLLRNEKGGIAKNAGAIPHLIIKELDYSQFLTSAKVPGAPDEEAVWRSLCDVGGAPEKYKFPGAKAEFIADFLKNPKEGTALLNKIYREAALSLNVESVVKEIASILAEINKHPGGADKDLGGIISDLDPGLSMKLVADMADLPDPGRCSVLVNEYKEFLKEDNLKKERIRLILNILWLENDSIRFKKMSYLLADSFSQILDPKFLKITKEAFELLVEKLSPAQMNDRMIAFAVKSVLDKISDREVADKLISFIPGASHETIDDIVYMLINANRKDLILEDIKRWRSPEIRMKVLTALVRIKDAGIIKILFEKAGRQGLFKNRFLSDLVALCGAFKVKESVERLGMEAEHKFFINTPAVKDLKIQIVLALGRIGTPRAIEIIKNRAGDPDKSVRAVCSLVLESGAKSAGKER